MRRKTLFLSAGLAVLLLSGLGAILYLFVRHEPGFYRRSEVPAGPAREELSTAFVNKFFNLLAHASDGRGEWNFIFTEAQLNSYFAEGYIRLGIDKPFRAKEITDPRIVIEPDRIRLGFRYGSEPWSTIVSVDFRLWLPTKSQDVNVICLEILGRKAGAMPVSAQSLLELISEQARKDIEVTWYRHEGNPVALLRFQNDRARPTFQLRRLELRQGMITIGGMSPGTSPPPPNAPQTTRR
jgi:hypothetical protein